MSSTLLALFIVVIFTFVFRALTGSKTREKLTPWVFAIYVFTACAYRFVLRPQIIHLLLILIYYLSIAFLLNGFKTKTFLRNKALWAFLPFVIYQFVAFRWGVDSKASFYQWLYVIMYSFAPGYCIASWAMEREDGMLRLLKPVACAVTALGFVFVLFGHAASQLAGSQSPHQGLNPGHSSENLEF